MKRLVPLEAEAAKVADDSSKPPLIFQLPPCEGRKRLEHAQDSPVSVYPATISTIHANTGKWGKICLHFITPCLDSNCFHIIYYIHGAGWVFGSLHTHYKLVCELAYRTNSIVIFPEYSLSPQAKYPTALEQCYTILRSLPDLCTKMGLNATLDTLTVAGDSVGGNMATVMTLLSKYRKGPCISKQVLFYPVTNACFCTPSYLEFAKDYYLYRAGMIWFWNQYTTCQEDRNTIAASPLRASLEQLCNLPPAIILNGEADVLRDEGEAYARKLRHAGVDVTALRFQATIHDFVMLNALDQTNACRAAMDAATTWINHKNDSPTVLQ